MLRSMWRHSTTVSATGIALLLALTGCSHPAPSMTHGAPTEAASPVGDATPSAEELAAVDDRAKIVETTASVACEVMPERMDRGPRQGARGQVIEKDTNDLATVYAFAQGDNFELIADRFCLTWDAMYALNGHPGSILEGEPIPLTAEAKAALP